MKTRNVTELDARTLPDDIVTCHEMIASLLETVSSVERRCKHLEHRLQALLRQRFGPSAEKVSRDQLLLFAREILEGGEVEPAPAPEIVVKQHKRNGRRKLPANLPRFRVEHDLSEEERACPCCGEQRRKFDEDVSEQVEYEPAKMFVIEHVRMKYACPKCEGHVERASKPRQAIEKCLAGPGLLAQVIVNKYSDHLPLYRLERIFKRHGVDIPRSTTCDWARLSADALRPLHELMRREVLDSAVIHTDDTPVPVQDKGRGKTRTGRFWVYVGDEDHRYAVFDYTPDRKGEAPRRWLKSFQGYLQADAYAGYDALYAKGKVTEVACWAHARRKFYDARMTDPARCHQAMAWIKRLYKIEDEAKQRIAAVRQERDRALTLAELAEIRLEFRTEQSMPVLAEIRTWLDEQALDVLPKSDLGQAIGYLRSRWPAFTRYTSSGLLDLDNNDAENALRCVALGRKNWLFAGSDRGGETAAILFSLLASARLHEVEPWFWMRDVLTRIADISIKDLPELLPGRWKPRSALMLRQPSVVTEPSRTASRASPGPSGSDSAPARL